LSKEETASSGFQPGALDEFFAVHFMVKVHILGYILPIIDKGRPYAFSFKNR
jgi:hypothetical protein